MSPAGLTQVPLAQALQMALNNYGRLWLLATQAIAEQQATGQATQATVDAVAALADGPGLVRPQVTNSADGESYNWTEYQQALGKIMTDLRDQLQLAQGPFNMVVHGGGWW